MDLYLLLEFEHSGSITIKVVFILTMFTVATIDFSYSTIYVKLRQHELKCPNNIITCLKLELVRVLSLTKLRALVIEVSRGVVPDISRITVLGMAGLLLPLMPVFRFVYSRPLF